MCDTWARFHSAFHSPADSQPVPPFVGWGLTFGPLPQTHRVPRSQGIWRSAYEIRSCFLSKVRCECETLLSMTKKSWEEAPALMCFNFECYELHPENKYVVIYSGYNRLAVSVIPPNPDNATSFFLFSITAQLWVHFILLFTESHFLHYNQVTINHSHSDKHIFLQKCAHVLSFKTIISKQPPLYALVPLIKKKLCAYESLKVACGALDPSAEQMAAFPPAR